MDKPKCRVCGVAHWASEPHKFNPFRHSCNKQPDVLDTDSNKRIVDLERQVAALQAEIEELTKPFDKKTYQREYMRKRRMG